MNLQSNPGIQLAMACLALGTNAVTAAPGPNPAPYPSSGITLEFVGQGLVRTPDEVYQYGFFTHVSGVENVFNQNSHDASTAFFTFHNKLATTGVVENGPLRIVDREGTSSVYLRTVPGATFDDPASFTAGTPVLTATLRHQVILDTANGNTIVVHFDLTIVSSETFMAGDASHRLGRPGQRMTWTAYGRPNTSTTQSGQFVFAGMGILHSPAPPGLSLNHSSNGRTIGLELENFVGARSSVEASSNLTDWTLLATVDHETPTALLNQPSKASWRFFRAFTE